MPALREYNLFISHAWDYDTQYQKIIEFLDGASNFKYKNYSVPKADPLDAKNSKALYAALQRQIAPTSIVIILAGMFVAHRDWIQAEIDIAVEKGKPIIGIKPWGNTMVPRAVSEAANEVVGWNTDSIVSAIRKHAL